MAKDLFFTNFSSFFYSRTAIAGAIIGLILVFFKFRHDFFYDHMTSQPLFIHSFMQFQLKCVRDVIFALNGASFVFTRVIKFWLHLTYLTLKNDFLTLKLTFIL